MTDRSTLEEQTARNLEAMELERQGRVDEALALYEDNLAEGFHGDWPYGRLVAIYSARGRWNEVARVLERGLEVLKASRVRTSADRRALRKVYAARLKEARAKQAQSGPPGD